MKLVSFDIFDTVLIRKCGKPENVFYLLAHKLFPKDMSSREDFLLWRRSAEEEARTCTETNHSCELTLEAIYASPRLADYAPYTVEELMKAEQAVEAEQLTANPAIRELIEKKRAAGYTVCFISDMYFSSSFLSDVLRREGCLEEGERVFVSCEYGARKSNGALYDVARTELHPRQWEHYGDNRHSDVKMARRKGIKAVQINTAFTDVEQLILHHSNEIRQRYELSILTGLQRTARLTLKRRDDFAEMAADFVAPAYIPYVLWVLRQAQSKGLKRLYFLSRDGHILMKMAESLKADFPEIEFRYLFVSRKSLLLPYLAEATKERYIAAQHRRTVFRRNVSDLLKAMDVDREELHRECSIDFDYDFISTKALEQDYLTKLFGEGSRFPAYLHQKAKTHRALLNDYFRQEALFDGTPAGMVDVGWLGTSRLMINDILQSEGTGPVEFFYYGVTRDVYPLHHGTYCSYYRPEQSSTELTALVEHYFSASPYPTTVGYIRQPNQEINPLFPNGASVADTPITTANRAISQQMIQEMHLTQLDFSGVLWQWSYISLRAISELKINAALRALSATSDFDNSKFVCRLSVSELFRLVCLGDHITAFDAASLKFTCGARLFPLLKRMNSFSGRLRSFLFRRFIR